MTNHEYVFGLKEERRNKILVEKFFGTPGDCRTAINALGNWLAEERITRRSKNT